MSNDIPRLSKFGPADRVADPLGEHATAMELVAQTWTCDNDPDQLLGELGPARQAMVAISRVLFEREGEGVLLLDEPTASLPEAEVQLLLGALRRHAERGQTIVFVTHRLDEVYAVADNAILLRDGRLVDSVSPGAVSRTALVELMIGRAVEQVTRECGPQTGRPILEIEGLCAGPVGPVDLT